MPKSIVVEGKTSTEAIEKGLRELNCRKEDVEIKILENENKKAFFSILDPRVVKVELTLKNEESSVKVVDKVKKVATAEEVTICKENIEKFLDDFVKNIGNIEYVISTEDGAVNIDINGENSAKLIGYRGDVMNSLQNILSAIGNKNIQTRVRVSLNVGDYKEKREKDLQELAHKLEKTVSRTGKKVVLEPMTAYERKILHTELQNSKFVTTYSIGEEPYRKIVVDKK